MRLRGPRPVTEGAASGESAGSVRDKEEGNSSGPDSGARAGTRMRPSPAVLVAPVVSLTAPVALAASAMRRRYRRWWWLPGRLFAGITQLPALLAMAWLVPGTAMLLAGRLLPVPLLIIFVPLAVALCYFAMRQLPASWPRFRDLPTAAPAAGRRRPGVPLGAVLSTVAIAAGFAAWQAVEHSQQVIVATDPGVYLQYGYWIAQHGSVRIPQNPSAFGYFPGLNFGSLGFFPAGDSLTPAYMPGLPLVLAAGVWLGGIHGALLMGPIIGGCAVLSFAGLVGRLVGPRWAPAGALVLALTLPEQYVSRTPFSEPLVQVLLFGGLCLMADSFVVRRRGYGAAAATLAFLGGFALGLTVLVSIGSLSMLLPA